VVLKGSLGNFHSLFSCFEMKDKKGQISSLVGIIGTLLVVALLIGSGLVIMGKFSEQDALFVSETVTNETEAWINETGYTLSAEAGSQTNNFVITSVKSASGGSYNLTLLSGNYTVNARTGLVTNASTATFTNVSISYTYDKGAESWVGINSSIEAMNTVPELLGLIILIVMIGIVLAIVFNIVPMGRVSGA